MSNKNPNVVLMVEQKIKFNDFIKALKDDWNYECKYDMSNKSKFTSYSFDYNGIVVLFSEFNSRFPEDIEEDIEESEYGIELKEIYKNHTNFWFISVVERSEDDLRKVYALFTRIVMSMLNVCGKSIVYDIRSKLAIQSDVYMQMYDNMQQWYKQNRWIFPVDWYVAIQVYEDEGKLNAFTQGFDVFNDYEIEIYNKSISYEELVNIVRFIVINVISRDDKIKSMDTLPVPINGGYKEAIVKKTKSEILDIETLVIIF